MKNLIQMKTLAITFVTLTCTFFAQTGMAMGDSIPKDARLVQQLKVDLQDSKDNLAAKGDNTVAQFENEHRDELETKCREIIYDWNVDKHTHCAADEGWGPAPCANPIMVVFGGSRFYRSVAVSINVYCAPRPEGEKYIKSVELGCEKNPSEECVKLIPQFNAVTTTTSRSLHRPN